jgi:hypothetical protein
MTDKEIGVIREALKTGPEWMRTAFEISLHTGCRLRETRLAAQLPDVDRSRREEAQTSPSVKPAKKSQRLVTSSPTEIIEKIRVWPDLCKYSGLTPLDRFMTPLRLL